MKQFAVTVEDNKANFYLKILKSFRFVKKIEEEDCTEISAKQKTDDCIISEEHQKLVLKRIKEAKPDDYIPWEKAKSLIKKSK